MITTSEIAPSPLLSPFVRCYIYREFDTKKADFVKPKHAVHEVAMHFFFQGLPVKLTDPKTGTVLKTGKRSGVSGMSSQYLGEMTFNGFYSFFEITFRPHGFQALFNMPASETLDQIVWSEEIFDASVDLLHERLGEAKNLTGMAATADAYLLSRLCKSKWAGGKSRINFIVSSISQACGLVNIDRLAQEANMSLRNFERCFVEQIGLPAKLYCCITRFNHALTVKLKNPQLDWTSVAHGCGYYDQTHLIKDFRKYSGEAPSTLLKNVPLFQESSYRSQL